MFSQFCIVGAMSTYFTFKAVFLFVCWEEDCLTIGAFNGGYTK